MTAQYNSLAFVAGFKRATDEVSLPEIAQYSPYYLLLNVLLLPKDQTFIFYYLYNHEHFATIHLHAQSSMRQRKHSYCLFSFFMLAISVL